MNTLSARSPRHRRRLHRRHHNRRRAERGAVRTTPPRPVEGSPSRRAALRQGARSSTSSPRSRRRWPSSWPRSTRIADDPAPPDLREHPRGARARGPHARPRRQRSTASAASTMSTPEFQAVEREMAPKLAAFGDQITQNEKLFARIAAVYDAPRDGRAHARAAAPGLARLHELRARGREARRRGQEAAVGDQPAPGRALHEVQPERARRRDRATCSCSRARPTSPGLPDSVRAGAAAAAAEARGQKGKWAITQHPLDDGAVPHLLRPARPAREGLAHLRQPRRQRRRARQQRDRSPRS